MSRGPSVITIGNFDGVHAGHAALVGAATEMARARGARSLALVFDPHPLTVLNAAAAPARLTTFAERERALRGLGADAVVRVEPRSEVLGLSPDAFVDSMVREHGAVGFVEGTDFCFGKGRAGTVETLCSLSKARGIEVRVIPPVEVVFDDHQVARVSSSLCRWLVRQGRMRDAALAMRRPYALEGTVVKGDRRGRQIGFPTANIDTPCLLPADAVYAARAVLEDGRTFPAAVNIGERPTFAGAARTVEAHLIDAGGVEGGPAAWAPIAGLPEYGWPLRLELLGWVRDQVRFDGIVSLSNQLKRDCVRVARIVEGFEVPSERATGALVGGGSAA